MTKSISGRLPVRGVLAHLRCAAVLAALFASSVHAAVLTLSPQTQDVEQGNVAAVNVLVTGLSSQRIGAYDFWVNFNEDVLDLLSVDPGPSLGQPFDSLLLTTVDAGRIDVAEVSLLADLSG